MNAARPRLLVVDDRDRTIELAHALLRDFDYVTRCELEGPCWQCPRREGCALTHAHDWAETEQALARHRDVDVVLLDVAFDLGEERLLPVLGAGDDPERRRRLQGLAILERLRCSRPELPVVLMTSQEELELERAEAALAADELVTLAGGDAYDARALALLVERVLSLRRARADASDYLFGRSRAMDRLRHDALALAPTSLPMLLLGETGTGKSALARRVIHAASRRSGSFVSVDLSALPESLLAAELFGSVRGAFSGAVDRAGLFERASGGTLLLDEIGSLPLDVQKTLLLVLQERAVTRLGDDRARSVDVKVVAATHADLAHDVRAGRFRADLYARLNPAARLELPPLRARPEDLEPLLASLLKRTFAVGADRALLVRYLERAGLGGLEPSAELVFGKGAPSRAGAAVRFVLPAASVKALRAHRWPGNVRELELLIGSAALLALTSALEAADAGRPGDARTIPLPAKLVAELLARSWVAPGETAEPAGTAPEARTGLRVDVRPGPSLGDVARDLERQLYARLFEETEGDFGAMAARLVEGDPDANARRVRLRFNQLGLRVRALRRRG